MPTLKDALEKTVQEIPAIALRKLVLRKAKAVGIKTPRKFADALVAHLLAGNKENYIWDVSPEKGINNIEFTFSDDEIKELDASVEKIIDALPDTIAEASKVFSRMYFERLCKDWVEESELQDGEILKFCQRLEDRWGEGLGYLRLLLTCCRDLGGLALKRYKKSRSRRHHYRRWVLLRLHVRACQVTDEIICLMQNGFADGAMARWRTLHEIAIVAVIISEGDEDLAERYIAHDCIEIKRQADDHDANQVPLGSPAVGKRQRSAIERDFKVAVDRFGLNFASPYGWAADALNLKKPTFKDLQEKAGHQAMNSFYKLASFNAHAGARSLFFQLGSIAGEDVLLAGRSNAGLGEPGIRAAQTLTLITSLYVGINADIDRLAEFNVIFLIRDSVMSALKLAEVELYHDEMERRDAIVKRSKTKPRAQ